MVTNRYFAGVLCGPDYRGGNRLFFNDRTNRLHFCCVSGICEICEISLTASNLVSQAVFYILKVFVRFVRSV